MQFFGDAIVGAVTGVITGFGVGGGTILVLYLVLFSGKSQVEAQGINLLYFIPCAVLALVSHIKNKRVNVRAALIAGGVGVVAAVISASFAMKIETELLRRIFGGFLIAIGISELFSIYKKKSGR